MKLYKWLVLSSVLFCFSEAVAQTRFQQLRARLDSALSVRYYRTPYDTNYVVRPEGSLMLKVKLNQTGNDFHVKGTVNGVHSKADLSTSHKTTLSIGASYRGLSASLALNPAKMGVPIRTMSLISTTIAAASASTSVTNARNRWRVTLAAMIIGNGWSRAA